MKFYGELLIFLLLLVTNGRIYFPKNGRRDPLVAVSPFTVILSVLLLFSWGFDIITGTAVILSILVMIVNFHAMFRYTDRVYVDNYSPLMKITATMTNLLTVCAIIFTIMFAPVMENTHKKNSVTESSWNYTGSFRNGFVESGNWDTVNATFYEYSLFPEFTDRSYAVLFMPDRRGDVKNYSPFLRLLAQEGCTTYTADFFTSDCKYLHNGLDYKLFRRFFMICESMRNSQKFLSQREFYTYNMSLEGEALISSAAKKYGSQCKFFIVTDEMGETAAVDLYKKYPDLITGTFNLSSVPEYITAGYGCVDQTNPFLARFLGAEKDNDMMIARLIAKKSAVAAKQSWGINAE